MAIQISDTRQTSRTIRAVNQDGVAQDVCHVTSSIRDGRMLSIQITVMAPSVAADYMEAVQAETMAYISAAFADAGATGIPVRAISEAT